MGGRVCREATNCGRRDRLLRSPIIAVECRVPPNSCADVRDFTQSPVEVKQISLPKHEGLFRIASSRVVALSAVLAPQDLPAPSHFPADIS
jgi:hypothetical protein